MTEEQEEKETITFTERDFKIPDRALTVHQDMSKPSYARQVRNLQRRIQIMRKYDLEYENQVHKKVANLQHILLFSRRFRYTKKGQEKFNTAEKLLGAIIAEHDDIQFQMSFHDDDFVNKEDIKKINEELSLKQNK